MVCIYIYIYIYTHIYTSIHLCIYTSIYLYIYTSKDELDGVLIPIPQYPLYSASSYKQ